MRMTHYFGAFAAFLIPALFCAAFTGFYGANVLSLTFTSCMGSSALSQRSGHTRS